MNRRRFALAIFLLSMAASFSLADSLDFIQALGIGTTSEIHPYFFGSASVSVGGLTATAWAWNGSSWQQSQLTARNDTGSQISIQDHGLGVCSAPIVGTGSDRTCGEGQELPGYLNELDNINNFELLQISRTDGTMGVWNGIDLSSLDKNGTSNQFVFGQVFAGNGNPLTDLDPSHFATLICTFNYDTTSPFPNSPNGCQQHPTEPTPPGQFDAKLIFTQGTSAVEGPVTSQYLYVWANNPSVNSDPPFGTPPFNDFLLQGVEFSQPVPEPGSLLLFGSGLATVVWVRRRKLRS